MTEELYTIDTTPFRVKIDEPAQGPSGHPLRKWNALNLNIDRQKTLCGSEYDDEAVQVEYLYPGSHEKVWAVCIQCGKGRLVIYKQYRHLCHTCSKSGERCSEETRKKISDTKIGENNHMFGKHHSEETRQKMSDNHADFSGENSSLFGKPKSEESRIKMSCAHQGIPPEEFTGFTTSGMYGKYCSKFNEALKERIREKYGRKCLLCPTTEKENLKETGKKLSIHHVDYNKNCGCDGNECRLVPLCSICHPKTNGNRSRWEEIIMEKVLELFPDINFDSPQTKLCDFCITEKSEHEFKISNLVKSIVKQCVTYPPDPHSTCQTTLF